MTRKPLDTSIAKFVRKILNFVPLVTVGTKLRLEEQIFSMDKKLSSQYSAINSLVNINGNLYKDYEKFMCKIPTVNYSVSMRADKIMEQSTTTKIQFSPVYISHVHYGYSKQISDETKYVLRRQAKELASAIAEQYEDAIYSETLTKHRIIHDENNRKS